MVNVIGREVHAGPKVKYWISYIKSRIKRNKNFLGLVYGETGSGKSYSCLRIAEELDPDFDIDRVCFSGLELMNLINSGKLKEGSTVVFEEAGVEMNNKNWASITNKMLNYLLQTFRHRNFILLFNAPSIDFVDSAARKLFHAEFETKGIDKSRNVVILNPKRLQYNPSIPKMYKKWLKIQTNEGVRKVKRWTVAKPSKEIVKKYEQKKTEYTDNLNFEILREFKHQEDKKNKKFEPQLTEIQKEVLQLLKDGFTIRRIAEKRNRTIEAVRNSMRLMRKKGFKFKQVLDGCKVLKYLVYDTNVSKKRKL